MVVNISKAVEYLYFDRFYSDIAIDLIEFGVSCDNRGKTRKLFDMAKRMEQLYRDKHYRELNYYAITSSIVRNAVTYKK